MTREHATALIADDEPLLRDALERMLAQIWPELTIVAQARNGREARRREHHEREPDEIREQEVHELHPHRREEREVQRARRELHDDERGEDLGGAGDPRLRPGP